MKILLVVPEENVRQACAAPLLAAGFEVASVVDVEAARDRIAREEIDVVLASAGGLGSGAGGLQRQLDSDGAVLVPLAGPGDAGMAIEALRLGAVEVVGLPVDDLRLLQATRRAGEEREVRAAQRRLAAELREQARSLDLEAEELSRWTAELPGQERLRDELTGALLSELASAAEVARRDLAGLEAAGATADDAAEGALQDGISAAERLLRMTLDALDLRRADRKRLQPRLRTLDVRELLFRVVASQVKTAGDYQAGVALDVAEGVGTLRADPELLRRVLLYLIENGIRQSRRGQVQVTVRREGSEVRFTVADSGGGVPELARDRLFERTARLEPGGSQHHRGLGLPFCKAAVQAHQGRIWVESAEGRGARFCFTIGDEALPEQARRVA